MSGTGWVPGWLHLRSCMGYYLAYSDTSLRVYDSSLNLIAVREFSVSIPGAWIIADFQRYNETTLLIRFEIVMMYRNDAALKELQAYILYTTDGKRAAETEYGTARLNAETNALQKGELYLGYDYDLKIVREVGLCSFYDREAGTCSFDTEEFLTFLSCMDRLSADYVTTPEEYADFSRAQEQRMLADGSQLYRMAEFQGTTGISEILHTVQDTPFIYAGFPLLGKSVYIRSDLAAAVMKNTAVPDGAKAFLAFLFSDDVQTGKAMAALGLPVTERALTAAFPVGYNYYPPPTRVCGHGRKQRRSFRIGSCCI